jgi:hypothetical protein
VHDEDFTGVLVLPHYIGVAGESNPLAIGREAGALGICPRLRNLVKLLTLCIHEIYIMHKGTTLIEGNEIVAGPVASSAGIDGIVESQRLSVI